MVGRARSKYSAVKVAPAPKIFEDQKRWQKVRFGDVVRNVNEVANPVADGIERFIGLEHLEPGQLRVSSWGRVSEGTTFTRKCRAGQVLFGKRRAYQRKVAVADWEAVVSGDIYVFAPSSQALHPGLLPFICMSDAFMEHAIGTSAGSLSPRTNWSSLARFEFRLPPAKDQARIVDLLHAANATAEAWANVEQAMQVEAGLLAGTVLGNPKIKRQILGNLLKGIVAGKSVIGAPEPAKDREKGVLRVSAVGRQRFERLENKRLLRPGEFLPEYSVHGGDFLMSRCNTPELVGSVCIVDTDYPNLMLCDKTLKLEFDEKQILPTYALAILSSPALRTQIQARAVGTGRAMKNISQASIAEFVLPVPSIPDQQMLVSEIQGRAATLGAIQSHEQKSRELVRTLATKLVRP
jgi:type I restriction enzyme S subunit